MEETAKKATKKKFRIRLNTQWKMVLIGLVVVAAFLGVILGYILPGMQNNMMAQKKEKIKEEVQIAYDVVNTCYQKQVSGALTKEAAQDLAKQEVGGLLYGTDNASYFWINDMTPAMVMHPIKPAMNGQDLTTYKDPTGALVFVNMVNVVKTQGGEGYSQYMWQYGTDAKNIQPKTSYVKEFAPWGWIVGTGIYTVDVNQQINAARNQYMLIGGIIAVICAIFIFIIAGIISRNIKKVAKVAERLAVGDTDQTDMLKANDEVGDMAASLDRVVTYLKEMSQASERIAVGDLSVKVEPKSDKDALSKSFIQMTASIKAMLSDVSKISTDAVAGNLSTRADGAKHQGDFRKIVENINNTLEGIVVPFGESMEVLSRLAQNDLTTRVEGSYEGDFAKLKDSVNTAVENLSILIGQLKENANSLTSSSEQLSNAAEQSGSATNQIATVSQQIAKGAEEQTRGIGDVKSALDELTKSIDIVASGSREQTKAVENATGIVQQVSNAAGQTAESAQETAKSANQASDVAKQGSVTVGKTIEGMGKINNCMQDVAKKIGELGKYSEEIGGMIAVIDDIAAQTNLLALNAAIEAARAGEQGRGFAVVADEVKKLAERTAKETKEISSLVGSVQKGVNESIKASLDGAKQAEEGSKLANEAGIALNQILDAISSMTSQIEQISAASEEMSASATEMVKVVDNVNKVAVQNSTATDQMASSRIRVGDATNVMAATIEENSAATEEMSASAEQMSAQVQQVVTSTQSLSQMAHELRQAVARFRLNESAVNKKETVVEIEKTLKKGTKRAVPA